MSESQSPRTDAFAFGYSKPNTGDGVEICHHSNDEWKVFTGAIELENNQLQARVKELQQIASNNSDWFDNLVNDLSEELQCDKSAAQIIESVIAIKQKRDAIKQQLHLSELDNTRIGSELRGVNLQLSKSNAAIVEMREALIVVSQYNSAFGKPSEGSKQRHVAYDLAIKGVAQALSNPIVQSAK